MTPLLSHKGIRNALEQGRYVEARINEREDAQSTMTLSPNRILTVVDVRVTPAGVEVRAEDACWYPLGLSGPCPIRYGPEGYRYVRVCAERKKEDGYDYRGAAVGPEAARYSEALLALSVAVNAGEDEETIKRLEAERDAAWQRVQQS